MENKKKQKRYYRANEKVWIIPLKTTGIFKGFELVNYTAKVLVNGEIKEFPLHLLNKYRKQQTRPNFKQNPLRIKIRRIEKDLPFPERHGDWIDLRAAETVELKKGESKKIRLGFAMALPKGYEAYVVPRSSTFDKFFVIQTNHFGVIDNDYRGNNDEWKINVYALEDTKIEKGDRICQFRIQKSMPEVIFEAVDMLDDPDRGGFGSTGHK